MKRLIAAVIAALAVPVAFAQNAAPAPEASAQAATSAQPAAPAGAAVEVPGATPAAATPAIQPVTTPVPKGPENLVAEPTASAYRADGPDADRMKPIIDALNAEPSLKASKITVSPDQDVVYLTGVTNTEAQRKKAMEIATQFAGEGKVANAITTEQVVITAAS